MANENKPLNEAKPNEPITAQRWNDMQLALRKEHIEHSHNGKWKDGQFSGAPLTSEGLADNAVITARIADGAVTGAKVDAGSDYTVRTLGITGDKLPPSSPALSVGGTTVVSGVLRASPAGKDSLVAGDGYVEAGGGGNPLRLTSLWSGFTDTKPNASEISNDTNTYKALMIVGNRSAGGVRKVALWDRVDVMGRLVVGPGQDAGLTVNGLVDAAAFKTLGDLSSSTLNVATQANLAALKVTGTTNSGPVNITGALSVSEPIVAVKGLQVGSTPLQPFNRVQIQGGGLHMDGNPIYLRASVSDQYDQLRWNPGTDCVDVFGFQGASLGYSKGGQSAAFTGVLAVRDTFVEVGSNANALRFTSGWSDFPASGTNRSEISNDTATYKTLMIIGNRSNDPNVRRVSVWDRLEVNGHLAVSGKVTASAYNIQFYQYTFAAINNGAQPRDTFVNYAGMGFVQVFSAFVVFNGFSLFNNNGNVNFNNWGAAQGVGCIPQHAFATVVSYGTSGATVKTFCSESDPNASGDNTVLATLVVIGRTN